MSSSTIDYLNYISKQINLYVASFFYISGVLSNLLCVLIFLSMKRLKNNPASIYLLVASLGNLVLFNTSFLSRLILPNFNFDPSSTSIVWCKLRQYLGHASSLTSLFCTAWAMIDQYLLTSVNVRFRQSSTVKMACHLVWLTLLSSVLHSIPLIIYNQLGVSRTTNMTSCSLSGNSGYQSYIAYFVTPFLLGIIPTFIMIVFAILAYANINYLHQEQMRTQIQQQLTRMVTAQAIFVLIGMIAYTAQTIYSLLSASTTKTSLYRAQENFALTITGILSYIGYAFNFYIYMTVSPSLRKQFKQLMKKYLRYLMCHCPCIMATNRTATVHSINHSFRPT
ncbi:hypothetical protein I4U23_015727 [Adineta vaga]|nr:hypothetical protein I4U23_015727 [Adineta vaga]